MGDQWQRGGYGNSSGEDFLSFGSDSTSSPSHGNAWHRGRRPPHQMQRISGTQRSHQSFMEREGPNQPYRGRGRWNNRGSNFRNSHQPYQQRRGGPFPEGGFGQRGNRRKGPRLDPNQCDISDYFDPSMVEDPWRELESLFKVPVGDGESSQCGSAMNTLDNEADNSDQESDHPADSERAD